MSKQSAKKPATKPKNPIVVPSTPVRKAPLKSPSKRKKK